VGIELKITADSVADLNNQMALMLNGAPIVVDIKTTEEGPKVEAQKKSTRTRRAEPASESTNEATTEPTAVYDDVRKAVIVPSEDEPTVVYDDVRKAVIGLSAKKGRAVTEKILADYGVTHATNLKEEQWADVLADLNKAMED
jgi:hypothetical protein